MYEFIESFVNRLLYEINQSRTRRLILRKRVPIDCTTYSKWVSIYGPKYSINLSADPKFIKEYSIKMPEHKDIEIETIYYDPAVVQQDFWDAVDVMLKDGKKVPLSKLYIECVLKYWENNGGHK